MRLKFFLYIFFSFVLIHSQNVESRELSIKQLEERKKLDLERKKRIEKRGKKTFQKEITVTTEIVFLSKETNSCLS